MKKWRGVCIVSIMLFCVLLLAGCGEKASKLDLDAEYGVVATTTSEGEFHGSIPSENGVFAITAAEFTSKMDDCLKKAGYKKLSSYKSETGEGKINDVKCKVITYYLDDRSCVKLSSRMDDDRLVAVFMCLYGDERTEDLLKYIYECEYLCICEFDYAQIDDICDQLQLTTTEADKDTVTKADGASGKYAYTLNQGDTIFIMVAASQ